MGMSKIEIVVTGNHGCNRTAKEGESLGPTCTNKGCVDCRARDLVAALKEGGNNVGPDAPGSYMFGKAGDGHLFRHHATMTHWPTQDDGGIVDDLVAGKRVKGSFGG